MIYVVLLLTLQTKGMNRPCTCAHQSVSNFVIHTVEPLVKATSLFQPLYIWTPLQKGILSTMITATNVHPNSHNNPMTTAN